MIDSLKPHTKTMMITVSIFMMGILTITILSFQMFKKQQIKKLYPMNSLSMAKQALLDYAQDHSHISDHTYDTAYTLPCPDDNNDGMSDTLNNNCQTYIGWLPFKTLKIKELRDAHNERLWYAYHPFNSHDYFSINGRIPATAIIIAPHQALEHQAGRSLTTNEQINGAKKMLSLYLEGPNANLDPVDFSTLGPLLFNDQLLWITHEEVMMHTK